MPFTGRFLAFGFGDESTWATSVSRTVWVRGISESMKRTVKKGRRPHLYHTASGNQAAHYIESDEAGGTIEFEVNWEGLGMILRHAMWKTPTTTGPSGSLYTHTYKLDAAPPTGGLTVEVKRGDGTAEVFEGCRIGKMTLKIESAGTMRCILELIAETSGGRTSAGTPSFSTNDVPVLHHFAGTVGFNSQSYVPSGVEIVLDNKFARRQLLGSKLTKEPKPSDFRSVSIKVDLEWENDSLNTALTADTQGDLTLTFTGLSSRTFALTGHNAYLDDVSDPVNGPGVVKQSATFICESDGTDEGLAIVIANLQSTAEAV